MSNYVLVVDQNRIPQESVHPGTARHLLKSREAAVLRRYPFTLILKRRVEEPVAEAATIKIDPGSKTTGIALLQGDKVVWAAELHHWGVAIKASLEARRVIRRNRRNRKTRYRKTRFLNRTRKGGWLPPSLMHRVHTTLTWIRRLCSFAPVSAIAIELVKFDTQALQNPEIEGVEYQQGELAGYELREYLLEKWGRECAYCGARDTPLQIEHIQAKAKGGSDRVSNLTLACQKCNQAKGCSPVETFLAQKPALLKKLLAQAKSPLKDAAAVNATRWKLYQELKSLGLPISTGTGGRTKWNRSRLHLPKAHWLDAACVGEVKKLLIKVTKPLQIRCTGHGSRQVCRTNKYGFPRLHKSRSNIHFGFQTGDMVKAIVAQGKNIGIYVGKVACRATGSFNVTCSKQVVQGISHRYCQVIHRKDGYSYV